MTDRSHTIVKICGITRLEDGLAAIGAGADWLGFIRWDGSPRHRPLNDCASLVRELRAKAERAFEAIGVYVDAEAALIREEVEAIGFDRVQLHGAETLEFAQSLPVPAIKAIKIRDAASIEAAEAYPGLDLLTDTADPLLPGGTGKSYDVQLLADLTARRRVIVAGGLSAANIGRVIEALHPHGVDVSSGVEDAPGIKNPREIEEFVRAVRAAQ